MKKNLPFAFIIPIISIFLYTQGQAQTQPAHRKKVYVDESEKTYWNKSLPVYIRLSTSPDEADTSYLLKSEKSKQYVDPYYLDTEGINYIRSSWAVDKKTGQTVMPKIDVYWEVYADGLAPSSTLIIEETKAYRKGAKASFGKPTSVTLTAKDQTSGVESTYYSINQSEFKLYEGPFQLIEENEYTIKYYSVDRVGNVEEPKTMIISIDLSGPKTKHRLSGNFIENVLGNGAFIHLETHDLSDIFVSRYKIDDGQLMDYKGAIPVTNLTTGEHTITYYSIDALKNQEAIRVFNFHVDKKPPFITAEILGDHFVAGGKEYSSGRSRIKLTAVDNKAGIKEVYYSLNGGEKQLYEKPFFLPSKSGNVNIDFYAVDRVNNKSLSSAGGQSFSTPYMDLTAPTIQYQIIGPAVTLRDTLIIRPSTKIKMIGSDTESGLKSISYTLDKDSEQSYTEAFSVSERGIHQIDYFGFDQVNNRNRGSLIFLVDDKGPEIFHHFGITPARKKEKEGVLIDVFTNQVSLFLAAMDHYVGYEKMFYSINGGVEKPYSTLLQDFPKGKDYLVLVRAFDKLGNQSTYEIEFAIE